ncbi:MAG: hypothetical protein Q9216_005162 [Gyalolechia sp. 2 TL-2023]
MKLHISEATLFDSALTILSTTTVLILLLIFILGITERLRRPSQPPSFIYWLLAHRLQNYLALLNVTEVLFLIVTFPLVGIDRNNVCKTELNARACHGLKNTWKGVACGLAVLSVCCACLAYPIFHHLRKRSASPHRRDVDVVKNYPYALTVAHVFLQASAALTLTSSFSSLFFEPANAYAALKCSMLTGAFAILCFDVGFVVTFWGAVKYHFTMRAVREEARAQHFRTSARLNWGRAVAETAFYNRQVSLRLGRQLDYLVRVMWDRLRRR